MPPFTEKLQFFGSCHWMSLIVQPHNFFQFTKKNLHSHRPVIRNTTFGIVIVTIRRHKGVQRYRLPVHYNISLRIN